MAMKTFNFDAMSVTELKERETQDMRGGGWLSYAAGYIWGSLVKASSMDGNTQWLA